MYNIENIEEGSSLKVIKEETQLWNSRECPCININNCLKDRKQMLRTSRQVSKLKEIT